jgi:hypothetical protein
MLTTLRQIRTEAVQLCFRTFSEMPFGNANAFRVYVAAQNKHSSRYCSKLRKYSTIINGLHRRNKSHLYFPMCKNVVSRTSQQMWSVYKMINVYRIIHPVSKGTLRGPIYSFLDMDSKHSHCLFVTRVTITKSSFNDCTMMVKSNIIALVII